MYAIASIFLTTSKREMIASFCKASRDKFYAVKVMPEQFQKGIAYLESAIEPTTYISKKHILEALKAFVMSESRSDLYSKIFSKIGKIVCFYLLANKQAMQAEIESILITEVPRKVNMKGIYQRAGKGTLITVGALLSVLGTPYGVPVRNAGESMHPEEIMIYDPQIEVIIDRFRKIDFTPLYNKIQ